MNNSSVYIFSVYITLFVVGSCAVVGCGRSAPLKNYPADQMVYVDTTTQQIVVAEATNNVPALHPQTGKKTLMPALYCGTCRRWYMVPPFDHINRIPGAARCPKTGTPLTLDGPWPEDVRKGKDP